MIEEIEAQGLSNVVSWQPHGRCFKVHDVPTFKILLQNYFKLSKLASFQRQLNLYGFQRLTVGLDKGSYYHERFLRSRPDLVGKIERVKVKGTGVRAKSNPDDEPNLYSYPAVDARAEITISSSTSNYMNPEEQAPKARKLSTENEIGSTPIFTNVNYTSQYNKVNGGIEEDVKASTVSYDTVILKEPCSIMTGLVRNMSSLNVFPSHGNEFSLPSWKNTNMHNATFPTSTTRPSNMLPVVTSSYLRNVSSCVLHHNSSFASVFSTDFSAMDHNDEMERSQSIEQPLIMDSSGLSKNATIAVENLRAAIEVDDNVSFDKLVDEMFQHDQNIEFPDLIKLATESNMKYPV